WTRVDALVTGLMPNADPTQIAFAYKLIATGCDILSAALLVWIAVRWRKIGAATVAPVVVLAMWLWNPLVNLELVGNAHNEALMIVLVLVGFGLLTLGVG